MVKRYRIGWAAKNVADCFEASIDEMAVTEIVVSSLGYSWKQWCPWPWYSED